MEPVLPTPAFLAYDEADAAIFFGREREVQDGVSQLMRARLVCVDNQGRLVKRPALWHEIPPEARPVLDRLVQARLLVSQGEGKEPRLGIAHETLFQSWALLAAWLREDQQYLLWRERASAAPPRLCRLRLLPCSFLAAMRPRTLCSWPNWTTSRGRMGPCTTMVL